jgi:murein DD-endopeptidase MepM/ murein hydrolase activator NlpD
MKVLFLSLFLFISCSHFRSGKYVKLSKVEDLTFLSKKYNISEKRLRNLNKGNIQMGVWIFVPTSEGIITSKKNKYNYFSEFDNEFLWPVPAIRKISSKFGKRWGRHHEGIDIAAPMGTHFLASKEGKVIYSGNSLPSYGNMIIIDHGSGLHTVYAHARKLFVGRGDRVSKGEVIGKVGSTGRSTGPHLHFEIRKERKPINPEGRLVFN